MFVFGFAGDSIAATTAGLLLRAIQTLETLTPGKGKESHHYAPRSELTSAVPGDTSRPVPAGCV